MPWIVSTFTVWLWWYENAWEICLCAEKWKDELFNCAGTKKTLKNTVFYKREESNKSWYNTLQSFWGAKSSRGSSDLKVQGLLSHSKKSCQHNAAVKKGTSVHLSPLNKQWTTVTGGGHANAAVCASPTATLSRKPNKPSLSPFCMSSKGMRRTVVNCSSRHPKQKHRLSLLLQVTQLQKEKKKRNKEPWRTTTLPVKSLESVNLI